MPSIGHNMGHHMGHHMGHNMGHNMGHSMGHSMGHHMGITWASHYDARIYCGCPFCSNGMCFEHTVPQLVKPDMMPPLIKT